MVANKPVLTIPCLELGYMHKFYSRLLATAPKAVNRGLLFPYEPFDLRLLRVIDGTELFERRFSCENAYTIPVDDISAAVRRAGRHRLSGSSADGRINFMKDPEENSLILYSRFQ